MVEIKEDSDGTKIEINKDCFVNISEVGILALEKFRKFLEDENDSPEKTKALSLIEERKKIVRELSGENFHTL